MISTETFNKIVNMAINGSPEFSRKVLLYRWAKVEPEKVEIEDEVCCFKSADEDWHEVCWYHYCEKEWLSVQTLIWHEIKQRNWDISINTFNNYFKVQLFAKGYPCFGIGESYKENLGEALLAAYLDALETEAMPSELIRERAIQEA